MPPIPQRQVAKPVLKAKPQSRTLSKPAKSVKADPWGSTDLLKVLVWGDSGTGKTTFVSTFPGKILWLISSGTRRPGELKSIDTPENRKRIFPVVVDEDTSIQDILGEEKYGDVETVVLDHVSGFQDLCMKQHLELDEIPSIRSWDMGTFHDWAKIAEMVVENCRLLFDLPVNTVILAQERVFKGKEEGVDAANGIKPAVGSAVLPSVAKWLHPAADYSLQTFIRPKMIERKVKQGGKVIVKREPSETETEFCLRCKPHQTYLTKIRTTVDKAKTISSIISNPTHAKLMKALEGGTKPAT